MNTTTPTLTCVLRSLLAAALVLGIAASAARADEKDSLSASTPSEDDRTKLQGTWLTEERSALLILGESSVHYLGTQGTYEVHPWSTPKTLDLQLGVEHRIQLAYELEGNTLVLTEKLGSRDLEWRLTREECDAEMTDAEWLSRSCGLSVNRSILTLVAAGDLLFAATNRGLYRSDDEGRSWQKVGGGLGGMFHYAVAVRGELILAGTSNPGIFRSEDRGKSWARSSRGLPEYGEGNHPPIWDFLFRDDSFWVSTTDQVYSSKDQGRTWVPSTDGLPEEPHGGSLAAIGDTLFLGTRYGRGYFRSQDGGSSWVRTARLPVDYPEGPFFPPDLVHPQTADLESHGETLLLATRHDGVFSTRDSGRTWIQHLEGLPPCLRPEPGSEAFQCALEDLWSDEERILAVAGGRLYRLSEDQTWQDVGGEDLNATTVLVDHGTVFVGWRSGVWARRTGAWLDGSGES